MRTHTIPIPFSPATLPTTGGVVTIKGDDVFGALPSKNPTSGAAGIPYLDRLIFELTLTVANASGSAVNIPASKLADFLTGYQSSTPEFAALDNVQLAAGKCLFVKVLDDTGAYGDTYAATGSISDGASTTVTLRFERRWSTERRFTNGKRTRQFCPPARLFTGGGNFQLTLASFAAGVVLGSGVSVSAATLKVSASVFYRAKHVVPAYHRLNTAALSTTSGDTVGGFTGQKMLNLFLVTKNAQASNSARTATANELGSLTVTVAGVQVLNQAVASTVVSDYGNDVGQVNVPSSTAMEMVPLVRPEPDQGLVGIPTHYGQIYYKSTGTETDASKFALFGIGVQAIDDASVQAIQVRLGIPGSSKPRPVLDSRSDTVPPAAADFLPRAVGG